MWHCALSNECKCNLSWDWRTQYFVLHNLPFPSQQHSHNHKSFMTKINDLSFSDSFCSLFLGTVFCLFSRGYLEFKLPLSTCLCTVLFICQMIMVPSSSLAFVEHFPFSHLRIHALAFPKPANCQHSYEMAWSRLKWTEKLSASVSLFVATTWHKLQSYWW